MAERLTTGDRVRIFRNDREVDTSTVVEASRASLMVRTIVPEAGTEVHSSFVAHGGSISAAHLLLSERLGARPVAEEMSGDVSNEADRSSFLVEHLAHVRDAVAEELGGSIRVEFDR